MFKGLKDNDQSPGALNPVVVAGTLRRVKDILSGGRLRGSCRSRRCSLVQQPHPGSPCPLTPHAKTDKFLKELMCERTVRSGACQENTLRRPQWGPLLPLSLLCVPTASHPPHPCTPGGSLGQDLKELQTACLS